MTTETPHLSHIKLTGYKSIERLDLEMGKINILIGANGSGKSNFLSVFSMLRAISQGKFQSYVQDHGGANNLLHFGAKKTDQIIIDIDVSANAYYVQLQHQNYDDQLIFKSEYCRFNNYSTKYGIKGKNGESGLYEGDADSKHVRRYTRQYLDKCQIYHFHDTGRSAGFKQTVDLDANDYLYPDARNIASFLYKLKHEFNDNYNNIVSAVRAVAPFFHDFYLEPRGEKSTQSILLKWLHRESTEPFSAQQLSDGTARFICMATLFLQPKLYRPYTIILDEPELGLHPAALDILSDLIKAAIRDNAQVICSTQSAAFANHFEPGDFIVVDQIKEASIFQRLNTEQLSVWLDEYRMGDIWNKNLIGGRPAW